jgi:hypothetical protein
MQSTSGPPASNTPASSADCVVESPSMGTTRAHNGMTTARTIAVMPA